MDICPVGAEFFHADRQTDMMKLAVAFHNSVNVLKKGQKLNCVKYDDYFTCAFWGKISSFCHKLSPKPSRP